MRHARRDYDCIQPWPTKRPHIARNMDNGKVVYSVPDDVEAMPIIPDDEPVFLIRGQDVIAPAVLDFYADLARRNGVDKELVDAVLNHADLMVDWQKNVKAKVPDAEKAVLR